MEKEERDALVVANLRFVGFVASHYRGARVDYDDLVAAGTMGMLEASRRYDPSRGVKFTTFAVWYIRRHIFSEIRRQTRLTPYVEREDPTELDLSKLDTALAKLSLEEQDLLAMTFGLWGCHNCTYESIGARKGVGAPRIRQRVHHTLAKLRKLLGRE